MNATQLWAGNDYAYVENRGRGITFYPRAQRVRVIRVWRKEPDGYVRERARTMVTVRFLTDEGESHSFYNGEPMERDVRARDIFARWEEYEDEREHREKEKARIAEDEARRLASNEEAKVKLLDALEAATGLDRLAVTNVTDYAITLNRGMVEKWLAKV